MSAALRVVLGIVAGALLATLPFLHARYGLSAHVHAVAGSHHAAPHPH
jgi:hypothetical protein